MNEWIDRWMDGWMDVWINNIESKNEVYKDIKYIFDK